MSGQYIRREGLYGARHTVMATKKMIVAICLMAAVLLPDAGGAFHETPETAWARILHDRKVEYAPEAKTGLDQKIPHLLSGLTTVREFHFIIITKDEMMAV